MDLSMGIQMRFLDVVEITNQGMQYRKGSRDEFDKL